VGVSALKVVAVIGAVGGAIALGVSTIGWERTLRVLGFDVTKVETAADSQCNRAREQGGRDMDVACVPDRRWLRQFVDDCVAQRDPDLVYVSSEGVLTGVGKCTPNVRSQAQRYAGRPLPRDFRLADVVQASGQ
jgi:hypothetical protein